MWKRLKANPMHASLGAGMVLIGIWLVANDRFFPWPPVARDLMNDDLVGGLYALIGLGLLLWTIDGANSIKWNRVLLTMASGAMAFLTVYQFIIWAATGVYLGWIGGLIITAFVLTMARRSDTRNDRDNY